MKKILIFMLALVTAATLYGKGDIHIFSVDNTDGKITAAMVEEAFTQAGYSVGINSHISEGLEKEYKHTDFTIYNAISVYHDKHTLELLKDHPTMGAFSPMGIAVFQRKGENTLYVSALTAEAQAKIMGVEPKLLKPLEHTTTNAIMKVLGKKAKHGFTQNSLKAESSDLITKFTKNVKGQDIQEAKENLEEAIEDNLERFGFVMPSYFDFTEDLGKDSQYDFYVTYSICKIDVINAVSKVSPEAAAFAPCTTLIYKKKNEDEIVVGFTSVYNWLSSATIKDEQARNELLRAQSDFESILQTAVRN